MIRVGIIGCGAIGSSIARAIEKKFARRAFLAYVSDTNSQQIKKFKRKLKFSHPRVVSTAELIKQSHFIIESASQQAARNVIPQALKQNKDLLVLSVGALLQIPTISKLAQKSRGHIYVPSGAVAGIDGILAAKIFGIRRVQLTTRKPLKSLQGSPFFIKHGLENKPIKKPTLIFDGTAAEVISEFPQNINVAATLSLAGIGPRKTRVRIFTSPTYRYNIHEVEIEGASGKMSFKMVNVPSLENPKTSALAIGSAISALNKIFSRLKVGT